MQKKENEYFEYVAWLEKQPNVIDFAKHYITTRVANWELPCAQNWGIIDPNDTCHCWKVNEE